MPSSGINSSDSLGGVAHELGPERTTGALETAPAPRGDEHIPRLLIVGAGTRFLSGISYYTNRLINALGARHHVSAILIRQMLPTRLYPGRERVGKDLVRFEYPVGTPVLDGIDWFWGASMIRAWRLIRRERPEVVIFQWWTGTVLHSYLVLALLTRAVGAKIVVEFHEVLDTAELGMGPARVYVQALAPRLMGWADGFIVHNEFDRAALEAHYEIGDRPAALVPHGPYDQYQRTAEPRPDDRVCRLLYFGVIRPFKGVEDIIAALDLMTPAEIDGFRLTVVGETWEGWTVPAERIAASPYRDRIEFINRYVDDDEVAAAFSAADVVVLPYHRSSASGPLHLAMASGLPTIVTAVGGLVEASEGYEGALRVPPKSPESLREAMLQSRGMRGQRFTDVHSWDRTIAGYDELFDAIGVTTRGRS